MTHWERVVLNLPGTAGYEPHMPWIYKIRFDGDMVVEIVIFVDDARISAPNESLAWLAGSKVAKVASNWGLQIALRKVRPPSARSGSWARVRVMTTSEQVYVCVSDELWAKTREAIDWIAQASGVSNSLEFKKLESIRGFLVYVSQAYPAMQTYLRGIHMTLDSWRPGRDEEGWKLGARARNLIALLEALRDEGGAELEEGMTVEVEGRDNAPEYVTPVPRLEEDMKALRRFTASPLPPLRRARPTAGAAVKISFLDASGAGLGDNEAGSEDGYSEVRYAYGTWKAEISACSSNYREMRNCLKKLAEGMEQGRYPAGTEIFYLHRQRSLRECLHKRIVNFERLARNGARVEKTGVRGQDLSPHHLGGRKEDDISGSRRSVERQLV